MDVILNILVFALVMGIIVFIHELGHLLAAKAFGVYCREFSIGMGPKIFQYQPKDSETTYSIRALPIGGFVAMAGEPGEEGMESVPVERTIKGIARYKQLVVLLAGVFMNLVLAFVVFAGIFSYAGVVREPEPIVAAVVEGLPADQAGLMKDDRILKMTFVDGTVIEPKTFSDASLGIVTFEDTPIELEVLRDRTIVNLTVTPVFNTESDTFVLGIQSYTGALEKVGIFETASYTAQYIIKTVGQIVMVLRLLVRGIGLNNVGGPVAIYQITSEVTTSGFDMLYFWNIIGSLSISLAVMNLLPIPVLDGGRALLVMVEMIIRRPIPKKFENTVMIIGFVLILAMMIFFLFNDFKRL